MRFAPAPGLGIRLPAMKERFELFAEGVEIIVRLLSDTVTDFDGKHFTLKDARCEPKPVQRPHPPIAIGGSGEKKTLRLVARYAQLAAIANALAPLA